MPKRKKPDEKPEEQFERFVDTARKLGVDETGEDMNEAFKKLAANPSSSRASKKKRKA